MRLSSRLRLTRHQTLNTGISVLNEFILPELRKLPGFKTALWLDSRLLCGLTTHMESEPALRSSIQMSRPPDLSTFCHRAMALAWSTLESVPSSWT
jgi:hypothetical protein